MGPAYYLFGAPGSAACRAAAKADGTAPVLGEHCLLNGPDSDLNDLYAGLPAGATRADAELVTVPQGTVVLQAALSPLKSDQIARRAEFYVLKDHVALMGNDITNPRASTDQSGQPDLTFGFDSLGQSRFETLTRQVARRGAEDSRGGGNVFNQHFAVALDGRLLTVPQISFHDYPDGVIGGGGADVTGGFTAHSARNLATELSYGALPLALRVVGSS
jgi:SecD/SecF fusion protein